MRTAFLNFGSIPHSAIDNNSRTKDWFLRTILQLIKIRSKGKLPHYLKLEPSQARLLLHFHRPYNQVTKFK